MQKAGYKTVETGLFNREELEGVKIRQLMKDQDESWKLRVPQEVVGLVMPEEQFR